MKKRGIFLFVLVLLLVTGCGNKVKEVGSLDNFRYITTEKGLSVEDNMSSYTADYLKGALIAKNDDLTIEMVVYDTSDNASKVQDGHVSSFANMKSTNNVIKKDSGKNYYKYTMITNGYYLVTSRIDNTLIFTKTLLESKEMVDNILENMGY